MHFIARFACALFDRSYAECPVIHITSRWSVLDFEFWDTTHQRLFRARLCSSAERPVSAVIDLRWGGMLHIVDGQ